MLATILCLTIAVSSVFGNIEWNVQRTGDFTYYDSAGYGACGSQINAANEMLVAVSKDWFTSGNPNNDPYCTNNVCIEVTYSGKSVKVPVKDKCMGCQRPHLDLSKSAFEQLAPLSVGHVYGAQWKFVRC